MGTKLIGPDIGCNIDIATDIALWNTDTSSFITFSIFGKKKKSGTISAWPRYSGHYNGCKITTAISIFSLNFALFFML